MNMGFDGICIAPYRTPYKLTQFGCDFRFSLWWGVVGWPTAAHKRYVVQFFMEDQCDMSSVSHKKPKILRAVKRDSCQEQKTSGALVISIDFGESKLEISAPRWDEGPLGGMMAHIGEKWPKNKTAEEFSVVCMWQTIPFIFSETVVQKMKIRSRWMIS